MTENATPKKKRTYSRPTRFPARIAIMTTNEQRAEIDRMAERESATLGETVRDLIELGLEEVRRNL